MKTSDYQRAMEQLTRDLTDQGKLIEAGFVGFRLAAMPHDADQEIVEAMRGAFFGGAAHLFFSILTILDPGEDETEGDMRRMSLIKAEMDAYIAQFAKNHMPTRGQA